MILLPLIKGAASTAYLHFHSISTHTQAAESLLTFINHGLHVRSGTGFQHSTHVSVDDRAVKEAVVSQRAKEVCLHLHQQFSSTSFDVDESSMKQALATGLTITQQKVIANPPNIVKITKKYQRKSTPALSSSLPNRGGAPGRAGSPEVSSSSGPAASSSAGS